MPRRTRPFLQETRIPMRKLVRTYRTAIKNRKGGSTKSNTILMLLVILCLWGYDVCLGEFDDNPYLDRALRRTKRGEILDIGRTTYRLFNDTGDFNPFTWDLNLDEQFARVPTLKKSFVTQIREEYCWQKPGIFRFLPGTERLNEIEDLIAGKIKSGSGPEVYLSLRKNIHDYSEQYDFFGADTTPQLAHLNTAATLACDSVLIPMPLASTTTIDDYDTTVAAIINEQTICQQLGIPDVEALGVVYQKYRSLVDGKPSVASELYHELAEEHINEEGKLVGPDIPIPDLGRIPNDDKELILRAERKRFPVPMYAPRSPLTIGAIKMAANYLRSLGIEPPPFHLPGDGASEYTPVFED